MRTIVIGGKHGLGRAILDRLGSDAECLGRPTLDLSDRETEVRARVAEAVNSRPERKLDALVVSAGLSLETRPTVNHTAADNALDRMMAVNFRGPRACVQGALRGLLRAKGRVLLVSSTVVRPPSAEWLAEYAASKGALEAWAGALAKPLARHGVALTVLRPGWFSGGMADNLQPQTTSRAVKSIPWGRFGSVDEVADFAVQILRAPPWCVTGRTFEATGGL